MILQIDFVVEEIGKIDILTVIVGMGISFEISFFTDNI